jgi:hypothetical protein
MAAARGRGLCSSGSGTRARLHRPPPRVVAPTIPTPPRPGRFPALTQAGMQAALARAFAAGAPGPRRSPRLGGGGGGEGGEGGGAAALAPVELRAAAPPAGSSGRGNDAMAAASSAGDSTAGEAPGGGAAAAVGGGGGTGNVADADAAAEEAAEADGFAAANLRSPELRAERVAALRAHARPIAVSGAGGGVALELIGAASELLAGLERLPDR